MKIRKSFAGVAAGSLVLAGIAIAGAPAASAATGGPYTLNGSPQNQAGAASYGGTPSVTLTATQNGSNVDISANISVGPTTTAFAGFAANAYRMLAYVRIDGGPQVQLTGPTGTVAVGTNSVSFPSGTTATASVPGLSVGAHNIVLQSLVVDSNSQVTTPSCVVDYTGTAAGFCASAVFASSFSEVFGFDAIYNLSTGTANIVANPPVNPIGLSQSITVVGPEVTIGGVTNLGSDGAVGGSGGAADTAIPGAIVSGVANFRNADQVSFSGNDQWNNNSNFFVRVCADAAGTTGCAPYVVSVATPITAATVTAGTLNPSSYKISTGSFTGNQYLVLEQHTVACVITAGPIPGPSDDTNTCSAATLAKKASAPVTILGTRTLVPASSTVSPGTPVNVTGSNWYPGETVALGTNGSGDTGTSPVASSIGGIAGSITVNSGSTGTQFVATGIGGTATSPFTISADSCTRQVGTNTPTTCQTQQTVSASVTAGALTQAAAAFAAPGYTSTAIPLGSVTSSVSSQNLTGHLNPITVADARGGISGWSLTAAMPTINGPAGTIANSNLAISGITCAANAAGDPGVSATGNTAGTASNFGSTVTLCTKNTTADSAGDTTGGQWLVNADLNLTVPAFQAAGAYSSIITVTLT